MKELEKNGIKCEKVWLTREDLIQYPLVNNIIHSEVKFIDNNCFRNDLDLTELIIHENVEFIGDFFLMNCKRLKKLTMPEKLNGLNKNAFKGIDTLLLELELI